MMTTTVKSVDLLKNEIEKTRQNLQQTDITIRKITGRDDSNRNYQPRNNNYDSNRSGMATSGYSRQDVQVGTKRRYPGTGFGFRVRDVNKESEDEDEKFNASLSSTVVATSKEVKTRDDAIQEQSKDKAEVSRNRRMFSVLMGTLNQFREDEKKKESQVIKRKEVEKKLEERQKEETEKMRKEKQQLFQSKKQQQLKLRQLEVKMEVVQLHEEWENQSKQLMHFIRTDSKPHIYYSPKLHTEVTLKKLNQSKELIEAVVSKRRGMLDDEINNILRAEEENFHAEEESNKQESYEPVHKKVRTDKENGRVSKNKTIRGGHRRPSQDQAEQEDSDLEFNRQETIGFDYQTEAIEHDKDSDELQPESEVPKEEATADAKEVIESERLEAEGEGHEQTNQESDPDTHVEPEEAAAIDDTVDD